VAIKTLVKTMDTSSPAIEIAVISKDVKNDVMGRNLLSCTPQE
jgi:hypothetical protein